MKNQADSVSITGTRGQMREVKVIRKASMLRTPSKGEIPQRLKDVFKEPPQVCATPAQIPNISYDDRELNIFETALQQDIAQFENKRGGRHANRHRRVREDDFNGHQPNKPYHRNKTKWSDHE